MRVFRFGENGLIPVGHYIAERRDTFWGVEPSWRASRSEESQRQDTVSRFRRDDGIWIFRYTGG